MKHPKRNIVLLLFVIIAILAGTGSVFGVTAEQVQMLQNLGPEERARILNELSPEEQKAVLEKLGGGGQKPPEPLTTPEVVKPAKIEKREKAEEPAKKPAAGEAPKSEPAEKEPAGLVYFGYDLFQGVPTTFAPATDIPIPPDYVVGPGDTIHLQIYGKINAEYTLVVSRDGTVRIPEIGPKNVAGLKFSELKERLDSYVKNQMIGVKAYISMGALRSIRIFVLGDVNRSGSYTVSALSTMTNALFVSGGIKRPIGSLRNVQLKREGKTITRLDLYDLLIRGDTSKDSRLLPGDVIFVPPVGKTAGVSGAVRRPAIYELKNEKSVTDLIQMAGGLLPTAARTEVRLNRISDTGERVVIDIDLKSDRDRSRPLADGDILAVQSVLDRVEDYVQLLGHVERPGKYEWHKGMRLADLITDVEADLQPRAELDYVLIKREMPPDRRIEVISARLHRAIQVPDSLDNLRLEPWDEVRVFGIGEDRAATIAPLIGQLKRQASFEDPERVVSVKGHVRFPGEYPLESGMTLSDLVRAGDLKVRPALDYALVKREVPPDRHIEVMSTLLGAAIDNPDSEADIRLQHRDEVWVFGLGEDRVETIEPIVAQLKRQARFGDPEQVVSIHGHVKFPGQYPLESGMTLSALIRAGDLKVRPVMDYVLIQREVPPDRQIEVVSTRLATAMENPGSSADVRLRPRDAVFVFGIGENRAETVKPIVDQLRVQARIDNPEQVVSAVGQVAFPGEYPLEAGMRVRQLVMAAGDLKQQAYRLSAELVRFQVIEGKIRETMRLPVDLAAALGGDKNQDTILRPFDALHIKQVPEWWDRQAVEIRGEVAFPGQYIVAKDETLTNLIERAGGLNDRAFMEGAVFIREDLRQKEQRQLERLRDRLKADIASISLQQMQEDPQKKEALATAQGLIQQLESTQAVGRLVIDLEAIIYGVSEDIVLQDQDRIFVPERPQEVTVLGEVNYPTSHVFNPKHSRNDYIERSGGLSYKADKGRIYIIRASGEVTAPASSWFGMGKTNDVRVGDTIVVPLDADRVRPLFLWSSVAQIIYQISLSIAAANAVGVF